nr:AMP-binding protein [Streptomyces sp. SID5468]
MVEVLDADGAVAASHSYRAVTRAARALADRIAGQLPAGRAPRIGVICGNTPEFVVTDLALLALRATGIPVPLAFTREQAASLLDGADLCLTDAQGAARLAEWGADAVLPAGCPVVAADLTAPATVPYRLTGADGDWISKVIHTSGTTSRPKGVRIRAHGVDALLGSLREVMPAGAFTRYLSFVPFSLLIEQVTGLYMVLLDGGCLTLLPSSAALVGTDAGAGEAALPYLAAARPTAVVATPALVAVVADAARRARAAGADIPRTLFGTATAPLICCGGAPVHPGTLRELDALGLPVHEGYGLSENSSVVSWNTPDARRIGTVGRPLPHVRVKVADDGELLVSSTSLFAGYTRDDPSSCLLRDGWLHTGDLAAIDADGFITVTGRKKNIIITAAGRNVAPEWVEAQYARLPFVQAVAVVGNGLPALHGLFVLRPGTDPDQARAAIEAFGAEHLSEVERVARVHLVDAGQQRYRRYFTVTGRPMRAAIEADLTQHQSTEPTQHQHDGPATRHRAATTTPHPPTTSKGRSMPTTRPEVRPYGAGTGKLVLAGPGHRTLGDLDPADTIALLAEAGFLVLRGFAPSLEDFSLFVKAHSARVTLDPARSFHGGDVAQKVDAGTAAVGLHLENGNSPFVPDLTWFLCERAAATGSQTTVCDGYRVWDAATDADRAAFAQDIVYGRGVEEDKWKRFVFHQLGGEKPLDAITLDDFRALAGDDPGTTITPRPDGSVHYAHRTPAARTTLFGDRLSWANSVFGPSYNYEQPVITFADGTPLPEPLLARMKRLTDDLTEDIDWHDGDVALIDNTRVMHGRRAIEDPARTVYNAQSYLDRDLLPGTAA